MKLAFWSPTPYAGRKSSHLLCMVLQAAKEGGEQLVLHADSVGSGPEHFLLSGRNRNRMMKQQEFGIEQLDHRLCCERFKKELVINSAYSFVGGKLHVLPAGGDFFYQEREEAAAEAVAGMMRRAEGSFQHVWVEVPAGRSTFSARILREADVVVINFPQSPVELRWTLELPQYAKEFFLIGAYERRSVYTKHNLSLLHARLQGKCAVIPYESRFSAACCAGQAERFLERGIVQGEEESIYPFFEEVKQAYGDFKRYLIKQNDKSGKEEAYAAERI